MRLPARMCSFRSSLMTVDPDLRLIGLVATEISGYNYLMKKDTRESRDNERVALLDQLGDLSRIEQQASNLFDERIGEFLGINRTDGRCFDIIARLGRV